MLHRLLFPITEPCNHEVFRGTGEGQALGGLVYEVCSKGLLFEYPVHFPLVLNCFCQEWKQGKGQIGNLLPKYVPDADVSDLTKPRQPVLKMCSMTSGHLSIPKTIRDKWLQDPIRSDLSYFRVFPSFRKCFEVFVQLLLTLLKLFDGQ